GVIRANDPREFIAAFERIAAILAEPDAAPPDGAHRALLVEEFVPGREIALEGLLVGGSLHVLAIFDKPDPLDGPFFEETIYVTPSRLPAATQARVAAVTPDAGAGPGLTRGAAHAERRAAARRRFMRSFSSTSAACPCSRSRRGPSGGSARARSPSARGSASKT